MAQLWAVVIISVVLVLLVTMTLRLRQEHARSSWAGIVIALCCGIAGAFLIVRQRADVVPDEFEALLVASLIVLGSVGLIVLTWTRWSHD